MDHAQHLLRAVSIVVLAVLVYVVARNFAVPTSFGQEGWYRYDALADFAAKEPVHGGQRSCQPCHAVKYQDITKGRHEGIDCENCHYPLTFHVRDGKKIANMPIRKEYPLCLICHAKQAARPKQQPQIILREHVAQAGLEPGAPIPKDICFNCHNPHTPSLR